MVSNIFEVMTKAFAKEQEDTALVKLLADMIMASAFQGCEIGNASVTFVTLVTSCRSKDDDGCAPRSLKFYVDIVILAIAMAKMF